MSRKKKRNQSVEEFLDTDMDDRFAFIAGYTGAGFPYGTTWEELGIDPALPMDEKKRLYDEQLVPTDRTLAADNRATVKSLFHRISVIHTTLQDMYLSTDQPELRDAMNGLVAAIISLSGLWEEEKRPPIPELRDNDEIVEIDDSELPF